MSCQNKSPLGVLASSPILALWLKTGVIDDVRAFGEEVLLAAVGSFARGYPSTKDVDVAVLYVAYLPTPSRLLKNPRLKQSIPQKTAAGDGMTFDLSYREILSFYKNVMDGSYNAVEMSYHFIKSPLRDPVVGSINQNIVNNLPSFADISNFCTSLISFGKNRIFEKGEFSQKNAANFLYACGLIDHLVNQKENSWMTLYADLRDHETQSNLEKMIQEGYSFLEKLGTSAPLPEPLFRERISQQLAQFTLAKMLKMEENEI